MLTHQTLGPTTAGKYLVAYPTPGCDIPTIVCICNTAGQADEEAARLNAAQQEQTIELKRIVSCILFEDTEVN